MKDKDLTVKKKLDIGAKEIQQVNMVNPGGPNTSQSISPLPSHQ